ncbi:MAG TPA: carboxypeptidase-like regulatory domain-containing protein, partial [Longimicrobium sp.]|nr:carboxypeptidase-like regulatory domain-containing protein [Longimicrobium sp.]
MAFLDPQNFLGRVLRALAVCAALLAAGPLGAQTVRGVLVDDTARPVPGALVVLVYPGGASDGGAMTDARGRFTLVAALPGRYTVRAERTGYRTVEVVVDLAAGETADVRLATAVQLFVLPTVDVVGESPCVVRPGRGAAYTLWDEARKALRSAAFLQDAHRVKYTVRTYRNHTVMGTGRMRRNRDEPRRVTGRPFVTLPPAQLAEGGYVRVQGDSVAFYGPDAHVLLSDEFLDTHCLFVDARAGDGRTVALGFEPIRRRGVVDIRGIIRLNRRTGDLSSVEYSYTELGGATRRTPAGGSVDFERLPNGAWVVTHWRIRTMNVARGV